jgi:hypothetical protein
MLFILCFSLPNRETTPANIRSLSAGFSIQIPREAIDGDACDISDELVRQPLSAETMAADKNT